MRLMWFVLAGFVLGFAASTLWEWYYYRKQRIRLQNQQLAELEAELRTVDEAAGEHLPEAGNGAWQSADYQSPGVFLEAEEPAVEPPSTVAEARVAGAAVGLVRAEPDDRSFEVAERAIAEEAETDVVALSVPAGDAEEAPPVVDDSKAGEEPTGDGVARARFRAPIPRRSLGYPDDLADIKGIGEVYRRRLYDAGIFTWHQVAQADVETLRAATRAQASSNAEEWPVQAQALAEVHRRVGATYVGPVPDDLTEIPGIGPVSAQQLYRAGICTFEQLAAALPDELAALFTAPVAGHEFDFKKWLARAAELADAKRTSTTVPS